MHKTHRHTGSRSAFGKVVGTSAVAVASVALLLAASDGASLAAPPTRPADQAVCGSLGGVLPTADQVCTTIVDALPLPLPDRPVPELSVPVLPDPGSTVPALPSVPSTVDPSAAGLADVAPTPADDVPSLAVVPGAVATVVSTADPTVDAVHDSLPAADIGALPVATLPSALSPALGAVVGAGNSVAHTVTAALPIAKPVVGPLIATVAAVPAQVADVVGAAANGNPAATPTAAPTAAPAAASGLVATAEPGVPFNPAPNWAISGFASEHAAVTPKQERASNGSLPVTGFDFASVGLVGAIAIGWGSIARSLAARKRLMPDS
ncbi:MAG: hypothetical protein JWN39_2569 [Ilumatobacteraceae bacterium]|nr:hypothetical protein [Ilumatobacteraceae bacterium]